MNILITGAGGFIGAYLTDLFQDGHKVYPVYTPKVKAPSSSSLYIDLSGTNETIRKQIRKFSEETKIDVVLHTASSMSSESDLENLDILRKNVEITNGVIEITKILNPIALLNFSSMSVYPRQTGIFSEESLPEPQKNPDCVYGLSKYCSEVLIDFFLGLENIRIIHLRVAQVYGQGMRTDRLIPTMLRELQKTNTITVYGNGKRTSDFIELHQLGDAVKTIVESDDIEGIYNVGRANWSYQEVAETLIQTHGDQYSEINKVKEGRTDRFKLDVTKLTRVWPESIRKKLNE